MTPTQLFEAGRLDEAIDTLSRSLREHPTDTRQRGFLAELLCISGQLERADTQLDLLADQAPENAIGIAQFRQLIRAAQARQQFFNDRRLPELLESPSRPIRLYLEASLALHDNDMGEARRLLDAAESERARPRGTCNGGPFSDLRDLDDLTAGVLEVLTTTGKYYWIPLDRVFHLQFSPPKTARDLLWREARLETVAGTDGQVFIPSIYPAAPSTDDKARLGRRTDWTESEAGPVRGVGQRMFLIDDETLGIMGINELILDPDRPAEKDSRR